MAKYRVLIDYADIAISSEIQSKSYTFDCNTINSLAIAVNKYLESAKKYKHWYLEVEKAIDGQWQPINSNRVLHIFNLDLTRRYKVLNCFSGEVEAVASNIEDCIAFIEYTDGPELQWHCNYAQDCIDNWEPYAEFYPSYYVKYKGKSYDITNICLLKEILK